MTNVPFSQQMCSVKSKFYLSTPGGLGCCPFLGGGSDVVDILFIVTPIVGVCNCSMFCYTLCNVHSSIAIILFGKRELVALLNLFSWARNYNASLELRKT